MYTLQLEFDFVSANFRQNLNNVYRLFKTHLKLCNIKIKALTFAKSYPPTPKKIQNKDKVIVLTSKMSGPSIEGWDGGVTLL